MADDEEAVEHAERDRWHSKEIHGCNGFPMVSKKGQPALGPVGISRRSFHPTRDGSLGRVTISQQLMDLVPVSQLPDISPTLLTPMGVRRRVST
jgi:hypothetical protein